MPIKIMKAQGLKNAPAEFAAADELVSKFTMEYVNRRTTQDKVHASKAIQEVVSAFVNTAGSLLAYASVKTGSDLRDVQNDLDELCEAFKESVISRFEHAVLKEMKEKGKEKKE